MSGYVDRRQFLTATGAAGIATLAGCVGGGGGGDETNIGMVYALGGLGDKSFNDMAHQGVKNAAEDFDIEFENTEPSGPSDFKTLQQKFAQSENPTYELICCIGFAQTSALVENAAQFPDQNFMLVDSVATKENGDLFGNVANYVFKEHQGSFQVGHLAGLLTGMDFSKGGGETNEEKVVGFVGGKEIDLIKKFQAGYEAGVHHADSGIEVRSAYAGSWSDPAKGKEIALSMYDAGADVVYHAAGGTGTGVFGAAQEKGRYAIGVDSDQSKSASEYKDVIVASMVKHVDTAVYTSIENIVNESFKGGNVNALGLADGGVEAVIGQAFQGKLPGEITSKLESSKQAIVDGDIKVPTKPK